MKALKTENLGSLEVLSTEAVSPDSRSLTIILFHGFGANCHDLFPLSQEVRVPAKTQWIFPNGPLEVEIGPGFYGRAWFPIDMKEHQLAQAQGRQVDYSTKSSARILPARDRALKMLKALNRPMDQVVLGGFSQGAMLALELTLSLPQPPRGVVLLSGTLIDQSSWAERAQRHPGLSFFQSHGTKDPVLPYSGAQGLEELLKSAQWQGNLVSFSGGHEIPFTVIKSLSQFLGGLSPSS